MVAIEMQIEIGEEDVDVTVEAEICKDGRDLYVDGITITRDGKSIKHRLSRRERETFDAKLEEYFYEIGV